MRAGFSKKRHSPRPIACAIALLAAVSGVVLLASSTGADEPSPFRVETVASGLDNPWSLAFLPEGGALLTERVGQLRVIENGRLRRAPVTGIPAIDHANDGGLLDVVLHPQFATNRLIFYVYAPGYPGPNPTRVVRARFDGTRLSEQKTILEIAVPPETLIHSRGGRLVFLPDGTLIVSSGDGLGDGKVSQDLMSPMGKLLRITDDGGIPADNPFAGRSDALPTIYTVGVRNPMGLFYDKPTGRLFEHEHGPMGGDEVNIIRRGENYGWPRVTHGVDYSGAMISPHKSLPGLVDPIAVWVPSIAPSGLTVYRGTMFPAWEGDLLAGAMMGEHLRRLDLDADGKVLRQEVLLKSLGKRIRDVRVAPDGAIWVLTDRDDAKLLRLTPGGATRVAAR